jgi:hypothetical protein
VAQQAAQALDDGQAQAGAAVVGMAFVQAAEFLEDLRCRLSGMPAPGRAPRCAPGPGGGSPRRCGLARVADGVGDKFCRMRRSSASSLRTISAVGMQSAQASLWPACRSCAAPPQQQAQREVAHTHFQLARFHARDVEQAGEDGVLRGQRPSMLSATWRPASSCRWLRSRR